MSGYSYSLSCPVPMGVNKNVIRLMKDTLGHDRVRSTHTEVVRLQDTWWEWRQKVQGSQVVHREEDARL